MRFLLSSLVALCGLSAVSGQCVVKTASTGATQCTSVVSAEVEFATGAPPIVNIPTFDTSNGIIDAVWVNWVEAKYEPVGTYTNTGGASATAFRVSCRIQQFHLKSAVDDSVYEFADISVNPVLRGGRSVGTDLANNIPGQCFTYTDAFSLQSRCNSGGFQSLAFQMTDQQYFSTNLAPAATATFSPDFTVAATYVAFNGFDGTATNGLRITPGAVPAGYTSASGANWVLTTPSALVAEFVQSGTGVSLSNSITHSLKLKFEVQYDYHLAAVQGDPQFAGFQGQQFQVHGAPDAFFALISSPNYFVNARFDYLSTGKCDYNETACFTHPGTYMGMIYVGMKDANILVQAGPHDTGFAGVLINDKPMQVGDRFTIPALSVNSHIHMVSNSKLNLVLDTITLTIVNSDLFVNFDLALTDKQLLTTGAVPHTVARGATPSQISHSLNKWYGSYNPLHGLIGQTWRNVKYADNKLYQGDITEYQLDKIVDHTFLYCVYEN